MTGRDFVKNTVVLSIIYDSKLAVENLAARYSCENLNIMKNMISAQYGKTFKDNKLQLYFYKQWWYQPNLNYSDQMLTPEDLKAIAAISKAEFNKKCLL